MRVDAVHFNGNTMHADAVCAAHMHMHVTIVYVIMDIKTRLQV